MNIYASGEDYLKGILVLQKQKGEVRSIDLVRYMGYSKPSISRAVSVLREKGLLTVEEGGYISLTESGKEIAERIYERHRVFTEGLIKLGVESELAEQDACKMEHIISEESFLKLREAFEKV